MLAAAIGLVNLAPLRRIWAIRRRDFWLGLVALAGVLAFGVLRGVLVAVLISLLVLLHELDHPRVVASEPAPGLLVVRPEERLFFANARRVVDHIAAIAGKQQPPPRVVLVDLSAVNDLEITALERLTDQAEALHRQGSALWAAAPTTKSRHCRTIPRPDHRPRPRHVPPRAVCPGQVASNLHKEDACSAGRRWGWGRPMRIQDALARS